MAWLACSLQWARSNCMKVCWPATNIQSVRRAEKAIARLELKLRLQHRAGVMWCNETDAGSEALLSEALPEGFLDIFHSRTMQDRLDSSMWPAPSTWIEACLSFSQHKLHTQFCSTGQIFFLEERTDKDGKECTCQALVHLAQSRT